MQAACLPPCITSLLDNSLFRVALWKSRGYVAALDICLFRSKCWLQEMSALALHNFGWDSV